MNFLIKNNNITTYIIFIVTFFVGLATFKDYGIGIDDKFHRLNGFFWLNYILEFTNLISLAEIVNIKLQSITGFTLPNIQEFNFYSILFDVPAAALEVFLNINDSQKFYFLRHYLNFFYFFIGSIFFFKILNKRFDYFSSIVGTLFFILTPRIYGDSFYNMKDVIFLTFLCISIFYCFEFFKKKNIKNLIFFSIFSAFCIQTRNIGIFIPVSFFLFYFLSILANVKELKFFGIHLIYLFLVLVFLYIFWPYLWESPIKKFFFIFSNIDTLIPSIKMLYKGNYINSKYMPYDYIFTWIIISSPIPHIIFFISGFILLLKRILMRLFTFENLKLNKYDLWRSNFEKQDLFILFCFISIIFFLIIFNVGLVNTWKYLYFLNLFIVYIGTFAIYKINKQIKKNKFFFRSSILFALIFILFRMVQYHPYQGLYFNSLLTEKYKNNFDIDYTAIGGRNALEWILNNEKNKKIIKVAAASWTPLSRSVEILDENVRDKIQFIGQEYNNADYIYTNNISEVDKTKDNKYDIPLNFNKIYEHTIDDLKIYTIYKN